MNKDPIKFPSKLIKKKPDNIEPPEPKVNESVIDNKIDSPVEVHEHAAKEKILANRTNEPMPNEAFSTEFLDNLAHQMVAPLQSIEQTCSNILKKRIPGPEVETRLAEIIGHTKILTELARRMRFLHQLVSGADIGPENLKFENIVSTWIDGHNNYIVFLRDKKIEVKIDSEKMNPLPTVFASRLAAHQVIMNLFDNAMKYARENSTITITASLRGKQVINTFRHVANVVLTQEAVSRLFVERGFRSEEAKKARAAGTGLGMYISKKLMQSMKGDLVAHATGDNMITGFDLIWEVAN